VLSKAGYVLVCFAQDAGCRDKAARAGGRVVESTITRGFLRELGRPQRYTIGIVPPRP
jgi:hypothetical protein